MAKFTRQHDWSAVVVEILVVIVGLMLAFQLDRWWEQRGERTQEAEYVQRLIGDIEGDIPDIEYGIQLAEVRLAMADLLMAVSVDTEVALTKPMEFIASVSQAAFTYTPILASHTFDDLRSTGNMRLLLNLEIKDSLYDYYGYDENQLQYRPLQFMTEQHHFELAAGVLTNAQAVFVQDNLHIVTPDEIESYDGPGVSDDEVLAAAQRLSDRPNLVAWLPEIRHLQVEQIATHKARLDRAEVLLQKLGDYSVSLSGAQQ
jgi:hypothetical protein